MPVKKNIDPDSIEEFKQTLEVTLASLTDEISADVTTALRPILISNYVKGRVDRFTEGNPAKLKKYIIRVADIYLRNYPQLVKVQIDLDETAWDELFAVIINWSRSYFFRKSFNSHQLDNDFEYTLVSDIALAILKSKFPYDAEFLAWVRVIVQNICLKSMRNFFEITNKQDDIEELDETISRMVGCKNEEDKHIDHESTTALSQAIGKIKEPKRSIIIMRYFDDLSLEEIAIKLNKSISAIYSLHFRALNDLRKILSVKGID
ncbi:hypothetical protein SDC9_43866 [bioreactor metagenome]|uniref:RNA polymerase sigma factor 70 region 4 type 2 domain-containing protein n=1 Tax=bioreactor metagenome TaxID=1076179 RepID=A0A644W1Q9_9ZZZZ